MDIDANKDFMSIKWKLFRLLAVVFFFIALGISWAAYYQQEQQLRFEQQRLQKQSLDQLNGQIRQIQDTLIQRAEYLALLGEDSLGTVSLNQLIRGIKNNRSNLTLLASIERIEVFSDSNAKLYTTGSSSTDMSQLSLQAQETEQPAVAFGCTHVCRVSVGIPLLLDDGIGVLALETSIADLVLRVNQASGRDVGVLVHAEAHQPADLSPWQLQISALSNRRQWQPLLAEFSRNTEFMGAGQYLIEQGGKKYDLALMPLTQLGDKQAYWLLLKDVTDGYQMIRQNNIQLLAVTWFSLLVSAFLLVRFIQPPLTALNVIASALPSLGHHDYDLVRRRLKHPSIPHKQKRKDELGMLAHSITTLTDELERLNKEVKNRTIRLHRSSRELAKQRGFVAGLLDNAQAIILVQDRDGTCRSINQFGRLMISRPENLCIGYHFEDLFGLVTGNDRVQLDQVFGGSKNIYRHEMQIVCSNGDKRSISWLHSRLQQADHSDAVLSIGMDITEHRSAQSQLYWLANHDPLTELPNRTGLQQRLQNLIDFAGGNENACAVLYCGLDHFKSVNDSLGHPAGDKLIKQAAHRLRSLVRENDIVARWGGDEFVIVIEQINRHADIRALAEKLVKEMDSVYQIEDGQEAFVSISVGVAIYPDHGNDATTLIKHADIALYKAKRDGRKQYAIYTPEQSQVYEQRLHLDVDLRYALQRQELVLYYQPQLASDGKTVVGVEALLRWMHPDQGMIPPDRFIPLAEESGQIIEIGDWVLKEACSQLMRWEQQGIRNVKMAINLAGPQIVDLSLLERIKKALASSGCRPEQLDLEITETFIMSRPESTIAKLEELKKLGIQLSIDDFGTGYSSLSYLKRLPIDKLKIDKSFVFDIGLCSDDEAITNAIIALGHSLNLSVIAEGVENQAHIDFLRACGCDEFQGFHFSKPLPADECLNFLLRYQEPTKVRV